MPAVVHKSVHILVIAACVVAPLYACKGEPPASSKLDTLAAFESICLNKTPDKFSDKDLAMRGWKIVPNLSDPVALRLRSYARNSIGSSGLLSKSVVAKKGDFVIHLSQSESGILVHKSDTTPVKTWGCEIYNLNAQVAADESRLVAKFGVSQIPAPPASSTEQTFGSKILGWQTKVAGKKVAVMYQFISEKMAAEKSSVKLSIPTGEAFRLSFVESK